MGVCVSRGEHPVLKERMEAKMASLKARRPRRGSAVKPSAPRAGTGQTLASAWRACCAPGAAGVGPVCGGAEGDGAGRPHRSPRVRVGRTPQLADNVDACCGGAAPQQPRTAGKCCRLSARARAGLGRHGGVADAGRGGRCGGARARAPGSQAYCRGGRGAGQRGGCEHCGRAQVGRGAGAARCEALARSYIDLSWRARARLPQGTVRTRAGRARRRRCSLRHPGWADRT